MISRPSSVSVRVTRSRSRELSSVPMPGPVSRRPRLDVQSEDEEETLATVSAVNQREELESSGGGSLTSLSSEVNAAGAQVVTLRQTLAKHGRY